MSKADRGTVSFRFGGLARTVRVELGLAIDVEEATGTGALDLAGQLFRSQARFGQALVVIRCALARNGVVYDDSDMLEYAQHEGITETMLTAGKIMGALFVKPTKAGKADAGAATTGAPAAIQ